MKNTFFILICSFILVSCKKTVEKIAQDLVVEAMTNGQWKVSKFTQNSTNITSDFSGYTFQNYSNKTVDANKNGSREINGS
jgi:hypothetical protein